MPINSDLLVPSPELDLSTLDAMPADEKQKLLDSLIQRRSLIVHELDSLRDEHGLVDDAPDDEEPWFRECRTRSKR